jgi:POT family proton-dependent oligopeptide transporter
MTPLWTFLAAYLVISIGELCLSPIGLSMITKLSPTRLHGVMMGTWFLASAYGQYGAGLIGATLAKGDKSIENPSNFQKLMQYVDGYEMIGYIALGSGLLLIAISPLLLKIMRSDSKAYFQNVFNKKNPIHQNRIFFVYGLEKDDYLK